MKEILQHLFSKGSQNGFRMKLNAKNRVLNVLNRHDRPVVVRRCRYRQTRWNGFDVHGKRMVSGDRRLLVNVFEQRAVPVERYNGLLSVHQRGAYVTTQPYDMQIA